MRDPLLPITYATAPASTDPIIEGMLTGKILALGSDRVITYSFARPDSVWPIGQSATSEMTSAQKDAVRFALRNWASVANINFVEVADTPTDAGMWRFANSTASQYGGYYGSMLYALSTYSNESATINRMIAYALGISGPSSSDLYYTSIYTTVTRGQGNAPLLWDIAAVQHLYGANTTNGAGDTIYKLVPGAQLAVWDVSGTDTLDASTATKAVALDLRAGALSSVDALNNVAIAGGVTIENAIGGAGNDTLIGNDADNWLTGGAGNNTLIGGAGSDTAVYAEAIAQLGGLRMADGTVWVSHGGSVDRLTDVELLQAADSVMTVDQLIALTPVGGASDPGQEVFSVTKGGVATAEVAARYSGPVQRLERQWLPTDSSPVAVRGTPHADFIAGSYGDDAFDGGAGDDVLDGATGSNFLTGGAGNDTFFCDGRAGGALTWSTVTDLESGEMANVWGWKDGTSKLTWADLQGASGYQGATAHIDFNGDGRVDASMTFSGYAASQMTTMTNASAGLLTITLT